MRNDFVYAMDDDFNTAGALGAIFTLVGDLNVQLGDATVSRSDIPVLRQAREGIVELMGVFGIEVVQQPSENGYPAQVIDLAAELADFAGTSPSDAVDALLDARAAARQAKNFALADAVRDRMSDLGFTIEDTPQGARVSYQG